MTPAARHNIRRAAPKVKFIDGKRHCRNCDKPVAKGRLSYCSKECATDFEIKYFPSRTRWHVFQRDRGVCAKCGCDTEKLRRILRFVRGYNGFYSLHEIGFNGGRHKGELWQADHVVECANGGWGKGLDNFRTLCTPCHKSETARLMRELAEKRKQVKGAGPLFEISR